MTADIELPPIEHDEGMDRTYIPLPGGWEVQTKGKGSTFRICEPGDNQMRLAVPASPCLHDTLARMARDIHAAVSHATAAKDAEIEALRAEREVIGAEAVKYAGKSGRLEAKVERLAEALDNIARVGKASRNQTTRTRWIVARAISALNGDEDWRQITKPKGYHDALERAALRDHDQEGE